MYDTAFLLLYLDTKVALLVQVLLCLLYTSTIALKENSFDHKAANASLESVTKRVEYVTFDPAKKAGVYVRLPERSELSADIDEAAIVEFYNK